VKCLTCKGTGKEICNNPDHKFINTAGGEVHRLGCPCCGHDENYAIPNTVCENCNGSGEIMYDKESIYDEQISPLMTQIIEICKKEDVPMALQFYLKEEDGENKEPLYCTTFLVPAKAEMNPDVYDHLIKVCETMKYGSNGKPFCMAMTITKKEA